MDSVPSTRPRRRRWTPIAVVVGPVLLLGWAFLFAYGLWTQEVPCWTDGSAPMSLFGLTIPGDRSPGSYADPAMTIDRAGQAIQLGAVILVLLGTGYLVAAVHWSLGQSSRGVPFTVLVLDSLLLVFGPFLIYLALSGLVVTDVLERALGRCCC
jgi:hypothetical protein